MKSWKTTILGTLAGVGLLIPQVTAIIDDDPETVFSFEGIFAALAAMGIVGIGWFARDDNKSSEEVGAKKWTPKPGAMILVLLLPFLFGCQTRGMIRVGAIRGTLTPVLQRHDQYVQKDPLLVDVERRTYLRSTELLRRVLEEASKKE